MVDARAVDDWRRWVEGRVYESVEEKMEAVDSYLRELESDPGRVRSLTAWNWIKHSTQSLYAASLA